MSRATLAPARAEATPPAVAAALARFEPARDTFIADLAGLCRVAGISSAPPGGEAMRTSAALVAALADACGLERARCWEGDQVHPYVTAEWRHAPGAPTVLFYAHHDVQPFGDLAQWTNPPTEPTLRGGRLYARGAADDKGGLVAQLAAIASWRRGREPLPCNVRLLVDGEEEIGSPHLGAFLEAHPEFADVDVVVVVDTPNLATGIPALTCSLRGNVSVDVEVRALSVALHSGRGGGLVPDPLQALCTIVHRLGGNTGRLRIPGLRLPSRGEGRVAGRLAFDPATFRRDVGLRPGIRLVGDRHVAPLERLWARPALTVTALEGPRIAEATNQIVAAARARLSLRLGPGMDPEHAAESLVRAITARPPLGVEVVTKRVATVPPWRTDPDSPTHRSALDALTRGYGRRAQAIGAGGSIGFMSAISRVLPGVPCLLMGVEDPACRAHAPDESLHVGDWASATRSLIHLIHDLSAAGRAHLRAPSRP